MPADPFDAVEGVLPGTRETEGAPLPFHLDDGPFVRRFPCLAYLLACPQDGLKPRQGATVTMFAEQGRLKIALVDRHTNQTGMLTLSQEADPLEQVEDALSGRRVEWRKRSTFRR
jgi:hypothetical protein